MSRFGDSYFPPARPRSVRGGIKAQSRDSHSKSWWGRRWIEVLDSFDLGGRLSRGRTYARQGQVLSIDVNEGRVTASVQGSRSKPYAVTIRFKTISSDQWKSLCRGPLGEAAVAAQLLSGQMPGDIEKHLHAAGVSLFPDRYDDLTTQCSCPDYANPCKHIAAVYFLLAEEFDRDPFIIFKLRGMSKEYLLDNVSQAPAAAASKSKARGRKAKSAARDVPIEPDLEYAKKTEIPLRAQSFWVCETPASYSMPGTKAPTVDASLVKRLGNLPMWRGGENMLDALKDIYRRASQGSAPLLVDENGNS